LKKLIFLIAFALSITMLTAQPAPELIFRRTEPKPTFVFVQNITIDIADTEDYFFAYGPQMQCWGAGRMLTGDQAVISIMGNDNYETKIEGYEYGDTINLGFYDSQTDEFYKLNGVAYSYPGDQIIPLKWYPLSIYFYKSPAIGEKITLMVDTAISNPELSIKGDDEIDLKYQDDYFFYLTQKFITNTTVTTAAGSGTITPGKWWRDGWYNYKYTPAATDNIVILNAVGQNKWDNSFITTQKSFKVIQKVIPIEPPPPAAADTIYTESRFKLYIKEAGKLGEYVFIESLIDKPIMLQVKVSYEGKSDFYTNLKSDRGDGRGFKTAGLKSIQFFRGYFNGTPPAGKYEYMDRNVVNL